MTPLNIGVIGLGRAFTLMLPTFVHDRRVKLVAATDPIAAARTQFEKDFNAPAFDSIEAVCASPNVQAVYVASPHQFHADHVCMAAAHGKHVLVEKPMALSLDDCSRMIDACQLAGVHLIVGHSHSFNAPVKRCQEMIASGQYGAVRMISAINFTDFLYRPRRPEELQTDAGGGVIHSQATHQIDIVRLLGGGLVRSVRAHAGAWDAARPTEGAYSALLGFEGGPFASATYSGYGHYDTDVLMEDRGELGQRKNPNDYGAARQRLTQVDDESALKAARNYGGSAYSPQADLPNDATHQHFGQLIISCSHADLRPTPTGIAIYADEKKWFEPLPSPVIPRIEVLDELLASVQLGRQPTHSGQWARGTTAVCLAMLESARTQRDITPAHQTATIGL
jgi:phthalate 4,5-cis-dihydrodiol dehydrogenase